MIDVNEFLQEAKVKIRAIKELEDHVKAEIARLDPYVNKDVDLDESQIADLKAQAQNDGAMAVERLKAQMGASRKTSSSGFARSRNVIRMR